MLLQDSFKAKMLLEVAAVCIVVSLLVLKWRKRPFDKLYEQIKSSYTALPFIGHLYIMLCNNEERMKKIQILGRDALRGKYGISSFWFPHKLYVIIADPDSAEIVLKTCLEKDDITNCTHLAIGDGSIFAPVKVWRPRRKLMAPSFNLKNLNRFAEIFANKSSIMVDKLKSFVGKGPISMWKVYSPYSMDAISGSLGLDDVQAQEQGHPFLDALEVVFNVVTDRMFKPWLHNDFIFKLTPQYFAALKYKPYAYEFFNRMISEKREKKHDQDGFKSFMDLMIESPYNASDLTIREESFVLFAAGSDTSAVGLGYTSLLLARYPEVQEKVYQEIKQVVGDSEGPMTVDCLHRLKYLEAVIRESIRLYPPVPIIARKIDRDVELTSGLTLLKGCASVIHIWAINRNRKYWGEDADEFRPERFLESPPENPAAFMPFSCGPRNCLGFQYAMMSMKTSLSTLLRRYRLVPASDDKWQTLRVKYDIMMRHVDNYLLAIESRT